MIEEFLQLRLDQALATSRQRWVLGATAVIAVALATVLAMVGGSSTQGLGIMLVVSLVAAVVSVSSSGTHVGAIVVAIVALQWLSFGNDETSFRSVGVALCLFVFHTLTALMAAVPHTTEIDPVVLRRWAVRSIAVVTATVAVWLLVAAFERRASNGNEILTVLGLAVITAMLALIRRASATWWSMPNRT